MPLAMRARALVEQKGARAVLDSPRLRARFARKRSLPVDGQRLDPQLAALLGIDDLLGVSDLSRLVPSKARARMMGQVLACEAAPPGGVDTRALSIPCPAGDRPARLYVPRALTAPSPAILYLHGGGFVTCDLDTHDVLCRRLALGARARVVSLDYRLAPEHPYPAPVEDAVAAFRWLATKAASFGIDAARLAVAGDSAGGNLSANVARHTRDDARRPALQVLIYPAVDARRLQRSHALFGEGYFLTKTMLDWYYDHYGLVSRRLEPDFSPLLAEDVSRVAPALVYTAGFDPLRDEGAEYHERLVSSGVSSRLVCFDSLLHGFACITGVSKACLEATERMAHETGLALREGVRDSRIVEVGQGR
ncbi:Esterase/lipase [Labilithrix luteola]|uniref:Esterase/lipase n=1 Tax=Labilithrix luteola TaxID=1391654 RepID=A0A0K1PXH8_9BACT|nr:Esterase/lipase [Labilithrix luteola]